MTEEAKKRILERYSKVTILEAYLMLSEKHSAVAGKSVADVFNENLLAAPDDRVPRAAFKREDDYYDKVLKEPHGRD